LGGFSAGHAADCAAGSHTTARNTPPPDGSYSSLSRGGVPEACDDGAVQLIFDRSGSELGAIGDAELIELYRHPAPEAGAWLRTNFVTSLDGSVQGPDGRSGSINTVSDHHIFAIHRALTDAVLVGAGTARTEGYRAVDLAPWQQAVRQAEGLAPVPTLVVVSASAALDPIMVRPVSGEGGPVVVATIEGKPGSALDPLRGAGIEVLELGTGTVDLPRLVDELAGRGLPRLLCEGGPHLHRDLLAAGLVDELSLTLAPVVVGGVGARSTSGARLPATVDFELQFSLLGDDGALFVSYRRSPG
jgi:riboflavin biosynthesis pyrimidine reductase